MVQRALSQVPTLIFEEERRAGANLHRARGEQPCSATIKPPKSEPSYWMDQNGNPEKEAEAGMWCMI